MCCYALAKCRPQHDVCCTAQSGAFASCKLTARSQLKPATNSSNCPELDIKIGLLSHRKPIEYTFKSSKSTHQSRYKGKHYHQSTAKQQQANRQSREQHGRGGWAVKIHQQVPQRLAVQCYDTSRPECVCSLTTWFEFSQISRKRSYNHDRCQHPNLQRLMAACSATTQDPVMRHVAAWPYQACRQSRQ